MAEPWLSTVEKLTTRFPAKIEEHRRLEL